MRITGVETIRLCYQMPYALTYARGEYQTREALLVKVYTTDPDIVGWGEAAMWGGPHAVSATVVEQEIAPLILGEDPRRPEYLWEKVYQSTYYHGRKGIIIACLSDVDIALWTFSASVPTSRSGGSSAASAGRLAPMPRGWLLPPGLRPRRVRRRCGAGAGGRLSPIR